MYIVYPLSWYAIFKSFEELDRVYGISGRRICYPFHFQTYNSPVYECRNKNNIAAMAVIVKQEMSQFTLTRTPGHVSISQTQRAAVVGSAAGGSTVVLMEKEVKTFTPTKIDRQVSNKGTAAIATKVTRASEVKQAPSPTREERPVSATHDAVAADVDGESDDSRGGGALDVEGRWLLRRYSVFCEQLPDSKEAENLSVMEACTNCCCQARISYKRTFPKLATPLTKARTLGIKSALDTVCSDVFTATPIGSIVREFVIYVGFLFMLALCINDLVGFIHDNRRACCRVPLFRICKLAFSILGVILTFFDLVHHLCIHRCKTCTEMTDGINWYAMSRGRFHLPDDESDHKKNGCCQNIGNMDIVRLFVTPMITYPLLLLSMFQLLSGFILCQTGVTITLSFVLSAIVQISLVYLVRMFVLAGTVYSIQKVRTGGERKRALMKDSKFQQLFVASAYGQIFVELTMIAAIGVRFHYDYQAFHAAEISTIFMPTVQLWYMMVFGYFAAPMGSSIFLLTHYHWTQRFFIKFFLDVLSVLKEKARKRINFVSEEKARSEFNKIEEYGFCDRKFNYPFLSPTISILCILYCGLMVGFVFCAVFQSPSLGFNVFIIGFYAAATFVAITVNVYACAVALLWIVILYLMILLVASIFTVIILVIIGVCIVLFGASTSGSPPPRRHY